MEYLSYLLILSTLGGSYAHGRGDDLDGNPEKAWFETKGVYVAITALLGALVGVLNIGWWGITFALVAILYWVGFRSSRQAVPELDYMSRVGSSLKHIVLSYLTPMVLCIIPMIIAKLWWPIGVAGISLGILILVASLFRNDDGEKASDNRYPVELANGLLGGVCVSGVLHAIIILLGS